MPIRKLKQLLDDQGVKYVMISHSPAFTAQEIAAAAHIPGMELAKTVVVRVDGEMALAVLPASRYVDLEALREAIGAQTVGLAQEGEFKGMFPDCEVGAMPPFGKLYGMKTYVADSLTDDESIAFNAGTHTELMRLSYEDFEKLAEPEIVEFATLV